MSKSTKRSTSKGEKGGAAEQPESITVVMRPARSSVNFRSFSAEKYTIARDTSLAELFSMVLHKLKVTREQSLYFVNRGTIPSVHRTIGDIYEYAKEADGIVYFTYHEEKEDTFREEKIPSTGNAC